MIYILAGMHRSGTSMFARFMHESGINMGEDFYIDKSSNKYGHYEDLDFLNLQRSELARHFQGEDYLVYDDFPLSLDFVKQSKKLLSTKNRQHENKAWGWKDPRTSVFLNHWHLLHKEICFIFMIRKPEAVVNSLCALLKTNWSLSEKTKYLETYIFYNLQILRFIRKYPERNISVVSFEKLIENPDTEIPIISNKVDFGFDPKLFKTLFDGKVISDRQHVSYLLLNDKLQRAHEMHQELSRYF